MESPVTKKTRIGSDLHWISASRQNESEYREIIAASGISPRLWRLYANFWLVCLFFPLLTLIQTHTYGWRLFLAVLGLMLFTGVYFRIMWPHPLTGRGFTRSGLYRSISLLLAMTVLVLLLSAAYGSSFLWLLIGVSAIAGISLPFGKASIAVLALTLLTLGVSIVTSGGTASTNWLQVLPLALLVRGLGLDMIGFLRLSDALRELHYARQELARQAVTEERLRMARDLHDLLGHSLSLITLKSELAGRLLEKDPPAAKQEIYDVEQVARQALREVREAVAGYRQQSLQSELDGARQILEAAGITCSIEYPDHNFPPGAVTILAWVIREGVTNVIRHSHALQCQIRIRSTGTSVFVEIMNDGTLGEKSISEPPGSGLSGLAERVIERGGHLETGSQPMGDAPGFQLRVEIPIQSLVSPEAK